MDDSKGWECGVTSKCRIRQFPTVARHFPLPFSFRRPITPTSYHHIHFPLCFSHKQLALLITMPVAPVVGKVMTNPFLHLELTPTDTRRSSERGSSLTLPPRSSFVPFHTHPTRETTADTAISAHHSIGIGLAGAYTFWYTVHLPMSTC